MKFIYQYTSILFILSATIIINGCSAKLPYAPDEEDCINFSYHAKTYRTGRIFRGTIAVTCFRDMRVLPFYEDEDDYFKDAPERGIGKGLYKELCSDNLFSRVKFLPQTPPERITPQWLDSVKSKTGAEFVMTGDIAKLNMLRFKRGSNFRDNARIELYLTVNAQIIHIPSRTVIWLEKLKAKTTKYAKTGRLSEAELTRYVNDLQKEIGKDMRRLIKYTALRLNRR